MPEESGLSKSVSDWLQSIRDSYQDGEIEQEEEDDLFYHATDRVMANEGIERLVKKKQEEKAKRVGSPNPHLLSVRLKIDHPYNLLYSTEGLLYELKPYIIEELEERNIFEMKNPAAEEESKENFTYIIEEEAGEETPGLVIGGASTIIYNIAESLNWTEDERELLRLAHQAAADKNGYERHTLVGDVLIIPVYVKDPDMTYLS